MKLKNLGNINNNEGTKIPENFDDFLVVFGKWLDGQKYKMKGFLGVNYEVKIIVDRDVKTFVFAPGKREVYIPCFWLENFHKNLVSGVGGNDFLYSFDDLKFGLYHELSHFRDMIHEKDKTRRNDMIKILKYVGGQKVKFGSDRVIPIGDPMHRIFNCIDDIVVNTEVEMDIGSGVDKNHLNGFYKYNLFADLIQKKGGKYIVGEYGIEFVGEGKGTHEINTTDDVDYSKSNFSNGFPEFLLRSHMVKDQKILLPEYVENILFQNKKRKSRLSYKRSVKKMVGNMKLYFDELSKSNNIETKQRCNKLKSEYFLHILELESILTNKKLLNLLEKAIKETNTQNRSVKETVDLLTIINLFLLSHGKEQDNHSLDVFPSLRYDIYKLLFLPIQKGFVLMDLLKEDIKESDNKKGKGKGEGEGEGNEEIEDGLKGKLENENQDSSGNGGLHESPDWKEKIKLLEELNKEQEKQDAKELVKKQVEDSKYDTESILENSGVSEEGIEAFNHIVGKYNYIIKDLVDFFLEELKNLDIKSYEEEYYSKKGKYDSDKLRDFVAKDPSLADIGKQKFYSKKEIIEKIGENFKNIDLTLAIDVSGSTGGFRHKDGIINIISTALYIAMKHLESHIGGLIENPDYNIGCEYVLYGDGKPASSHDSENKDKTIETRISEFNGELIKLGGLTNDTTAWKKIAIEFDKYMTDNPWYVEEIKNKKRKPIVTQIADSDVSENGVNILKEIFMKHIEDKSIVDNLVIKRIIVGNVNTENITREEYEIKKKSGELGNWETEFLDSGDVKLKQVVVKNKDEILLKIKELFKGFFSDINS